VYGTFGSNNLFHAWITLDDMIIDFTRFQFLTYKEKRSFYLKLRGSDLLSYVLQFQNILVLTKDSAFYYAYNPLVLIKPELTPISAESYEDFLSRIVITFEAQEMKWLNSLTFDGRKFSTWLDDNQLRVTKRYISKFAIVAQ
jgi:nicotinic acid phosphoribosyltransferase